MGPSCACLIYSSQDTPRYSNRLDVRMVSICCRPTQCGHRWHHSNRAACMGCLHGLRAVLHGHACPHLPTSAPKNPNARVLLGDIL